MNATVKKVVGASALGALSVVELLHLQQANATPVTFTGSTFANPRGGSVQVAITVDGASGGNRVLINKLIWSDEFSGNPKGTLDDRYWTANIGTYSSFLPTINSPSNVRVNENNSGVLTIKTSAIAHPSLYTGLCAGVPCKFQSGEISTRGKLSFRYGYLEARIKVPTGSGNLPAFWMLPAGNYGESGLPTPGEIDVMEWYGNTPNKIWSTIHFPSGLNGLDKNDESRTQPFSIPESFSDAFHTFAVLWEPKEITFFVDARRFATFRPSDATTWPFDSAFYLILNGNVGPQPNRNMGGNWGSSSPSVYSVDWIRYRNANGLGETSAR